MPDNLAVIAELSRVKVLFQQRAVCAVLGIPQSTGAAIHNGQPSRATDFASFHSTDLAPEQEQRHG